MEGNKTDISPPKWSERFFEFYCDPEITEELQGDLLDRFHAHVEKFGIKKARRNYTLNVFKFIGLHTLRRRNKSRGSNLFFLVPNYIKTGIRSIVRQGSFSIINLSGLSLGLICFMLLFAFVKHELSFDTFHVNNEQIARINMTWIFGDTRTPTAQTTSIVAPTFANEFPEVRNSTRLNDQGPRILKYGENIFKEENFFYADSTFFDVFSFKLAQGNPDECLVQPRSILLSRSMAAKYFAGRGEESLLGESFLVNAKDEYLVAGIFEDVPFNSHLQFDFLASMSSLPQSQSANWDNSEFATYVQVQPGISFDEIQYKVDALIESSGAQDFVELEVEPMKNIYLHSQLHNNYGPQSDFRNVMLFGGIGILILIIACINYLNLVTAKSVERAKEVGLRKVLGAIRGQLFFQFMSESLILCFTSLVLAYGICLLLFEPFNQLSGQQIPVQLITSTSFIIMTASVTFLVSFLAGSYPSFIISNFKPVSVLKGKFKGSSSGLFTRKILIVVQFATSMFLIIGTLVVFDQLSYIQNKKLGFDKEHVLILPVDNEMKNNLQSIKNELSNVPGVLSASFASHTPGNISFVTTFQILATNNPRQLMNAAKVDNDFLATAGVELIHGLNFNENSNYEERYGFLLNEEAMEFFNWTPEQALGQRVGIWGGDTGVVVGIVRNFHNESLHTKIDKMILFNDNSSFFYSNLMVKISGQNLGENIRSISNFWKEMVPHRPFEYAFLDDKFMQSYQSEERLSQLFSVFAGIAILIACLGLLGLSSFSAVQKSKEMSIRKVLGASPINILGRFSAEFVVLILIAFILASPVAYLASERWLEGFAYKTELNWGLFAASGIICLLVTMITVGMQSIKVAMVNPAVTLKNNE